VKQNRHLLTLMRLRRAIDFDVRLSRDPDAERVDDLAVNFHPTFHDPLFSFAARAQAHLAHPF
jgi:hypothetical protein